MAAGGPVAVRRWAAAMACALACTAWALVASGAGAAAQSAPATAAVQRDVAARARDQAREVLAQRRFASTHLPAPLRRPRERIGEGLRSLGALLQAAFAEIASRLPGGSIVLFFLLGLVALGAAAAVARCVVRRGALGAASSGRGECANERVSAARLREQAERAEAHGDLDAALRLQFRAGLVELDSRELVELRPALTNHELLRAVPSPTLAGLVDGFEAVAYGGRPADAGDLRSARDGWPRVVDEAVFR